MPKPLERASGGKVHETKRYYRVRQRQPKKGAKIRTLTLSEMKGYKAVRQKPKGKKWETQAVLIEKRPGRTKAFAKRKAKELTKSGGKLPYSKLAGYNKQGKIWINPNVPKTYKGISMRKRLLRHEEVELQLRREGYTYEDAHKKALEEEHKGLTQEQVSQYEGKLGSIAKHYPMKRD